MPGSLSSTMRRVIRKETTTALYFQTTKCIPDCQRTPACQFAQSSSWVPTITSRNDKYSQAMSTLTTRSKG